MKKFQCIIGLLSCAAILTACGTKTDNVKSTSSTKAKTSQTSSSTKPSSSTETQSSSSEEPQKSDEELHIQMSIVSESTLFMTLTGTEQMK